MRLFFHCRDVISSSKIALLVKVALPLGNGSTASEDDISRDVPAVEFL